MRAYFAYGSNMWDAQMAVRCPQSRKIGHARLAGYRWIISTRGYANVLPSPENQVEGILFMISGSDEEALDKFESVAHGAYGKQVLPVICDETGVEALVYVDFVTGEGAPKTEYVHRMNSGLADARLSAEYVASHVRKFIPA
ncbi:MAG: gamma-glutamylcyclotransferase family protein [Betaproteobacteria bacterium]